MPEPHTTEIVEDLRRRLVLPDLDNDLGNRIFGVKQSQQSFAQPRSLYALYTTPNMEKIIKLLMIMKAKYLAITARFRRERVKAPWYFERRLMRIGRKKPKSAWIADGKTPETTENVLGVNGQHGRSPPVEGRHTSCQNYRILSSRARKQHRWLTIKRSRLRSAWV